VSAAIPLQQYVETRFNLLTTLLDTAKQTIDAAATAADLRYQQRYESQQASLQTAFASAEKAVQSALLAADRAVTKAELAADKRFDALNELRQMLNDMMGKMMTRVEAEQRFNANTEKMEAASHRVELIEGRVNTEFGKMVASTAGGKSVKDESRANVAMGLSLLGLVVIIARMLMGN
jgi:hypothetical protein